MRHLADQRAAWQLAIVFSLATFSPPADRPTNASDAVELLADQSPESLAGTLQPADLPAVEGLVIERAARKIEYPAAVLVESRVQAADGAQFAAELTAAQWVFRVAGEQDAGYAPLQHREQTWYESTFWQGGEQWLRVGKDWHHPGDRGPSVRRFLAPADGPLTITGRVYKAHRDGDGVRLAVLHNGQPVWQRELEGKDGDGIDPNLSLAVKRGDTIRFVVDKRRAISCDTTHWDPVITYADGQRFQASTAFAAKKQGAGGWFYETPAGGAGATPMPRLVWFDAAWALCESPLVPGKPVVLQRTSAQPCAVLADGQDGSGVVLAVEAELPWRLQAELAADGKLTVRLIVKPGAAVPQPGKPLRLSCVALGPYSGTSLVGLQTLTRWVADVGKELPVAALRTAVQQAGIPELDYWAMIQQDWQRQDGTAGRRPETYGAAIAKQLEKTRALLARLQAVHNSARLAELAQRLQQLAPHAESASTDPAALYLQLRLLKREIALANPLLDFDQLLFCKRVPTSYSHLVMQYYGWRARPGGGLFVLDEPGRSLRCRDLLDGRLQTGCVLEPRLSYDGRRIVFSYVDCPGGPLPPGEVSNDDPPDRNYYHVYEVGADGSGLKQLTDGPFDDLMPCYLPDGGIAFMSTRRRGYARCFGGQFSTRWDVYTLHRMNGDGANIRTLSFHDTNEWFPAVSNTGHILYARWDYIDRDAVTHQNLWASRPDGTNPIAVWGNATAAPHCTFQLQPIPDSTKIIFAASAHHSIAGGPITIVDPRIAADGQAALERITPEIPFPEAETRDIREYYTAPWPLSEDFYLVGYSPFPLVWEPGANPAHALGLYLLDRWGNRELLYRDPQIGSTNPCPLQPRPVPPVLPSTVADAATDHGEMVVADVYEGLGDVARGQIKELRIVQIFPKTTNIANQPPIGIAAEENGRAVLGTVKVESDGSARFLVPAGKPLLFQALDQDGCAYQTMRSLTYVQPGERVSCVGCHEPKMTAPVTPLADLAALQRPASRIQPGPWDGRPFSYVEVVQPVLDQHCVRCHGGERTEGGIVLTGEPQGAFSRSYVALMQDDRAFWHVGTNPDNAAKYLVPRFGGRNQIQMTSPGGLYGARGSRLMKLLREGHEGVKLAPADLRRLALWIDLNAIFYGVYLPADQDRMRRGELVGMPEIQ
ncbi:MAG: hypothetical protein GX575_31005 [Candidatus Anammoximicrobium sp.]|mgnify:CR=1 FL=1|nr:hypothetical protein [Candidatus Anammoximicrobium sp.]